MENGTVGYGAALLAGLVSFLSPCVLPLVPGYISFMSGMTLEELSAGANDRARLRHAGWEATKCAVPKWSGSEAAARVVEPSEVELA